MLGYWFSPSLESMFTDNQRSETKFTELIYIGVSSSVAKRYAIDSFWKQTDALEQHFPTAFPCSASMESGKEN